LAKLARTHPDWIIREAAVDRVADLAVLSAVATTDADPDVRQTAFLRLDEKSIAAIARSAPNTRIREQAVSFLSDRRLLDEFLGESADRASARQPSIAACGSEPQSPDPRAAQVRLLVLDPAIAGRYGRLDVDFQVALDEKRYIKDDAKGKVLGRKT
jgi:hypothetical protein